MKTWQAFDDPHYDIDDVTTKHDQILHSALISISRYIYVTLAQKQRISRGSIGQETVHLSTQHRTIYHHSFMNSRALHGWTRTGMAWHGMVRRGMGGMCGMGDMDGHIPHGKAVRIQSEAVRIQSEAVHAFLVGEPSYGWPFCFQRFCWQHFPYPPSCSFTFPGFPRKIIIDFRGKGWTSQVLVEDWNWF